MGASLRLLAGGSMLTAADGSTRGSGVQQRVADTISIQILSKKLNVDRGVDLTVDHCGLCHDGGRVTWK